MPRSITYLILILMTSCSLDVEQPSIDIPTPASQSEISEHLFFTIWHYVSYKVGNDLYQLAQDDCYTIYFDYAKLYSNNSAYECASHDNWSDGSTIVWDEQQPASFELFFAGFSDGNKYTIMSGITDDEMTIEAYIGYAQETRIMKLIRYE